MREFSIEDELKKKIEKIFKKDRTTYESLMSKIEEVLNCPDVHHYKNLRRPLNHLKRVHINGPFVLTFRYDEKEDRIVFYEMDHHDRIYL